MKGEKTKTKPISFQPYHVPNTSRPCERRCGLLATRPILQAIPQQDETAEREGGRGGNSFRGSARMKGSAIKKAANEWLNGRPGAIPGHNSNYCQLSRGPDHWE
ncbi:hypothetical protein CEXT_32711 [Caerostris extrusa]|uniref:Uncharacterized protein n=1 Tax=Caerostris extrusa TaxID=172846 RepID=A0AAV4SJW3_CAEEX|nr:hypothetical protein CEXT_32711 [Caerostris extrusa]